MIRKLVLALAAIPAAHAQPADIPRTADGRPDFQGVWESRWLTPFERLDGTTEPTVSGEAAKAYAAARTAELFKDGGALHPEEDFDFSTLLPAGEGSYRTSLITAPADGKRPQTQLAKEIGAAGRDLRKKAENPEALSNDERCLSANGLAPLGVSPGSMYRQIVQTPDHLMIYTEDQMVTRVIGIGAAPRPAGLVSRSGDSIAAWDGDALVVVTTQIRPQLAPPGTPPFDQQRRRVVERFSFVTPDRIGYDYVLEDAVMLAEPLHVQFDLVRTEHGMYESACHEGNYSIGNMMLAARLAEQREAVSAKHP